MRKEENATNPGSRGLLVIHNFLKISGWAGTNATNYGII